MSGTAPAAGDVSRADALYALDATLAAVCLRVSVGRGLVSLDESLAAHFAYLAFTYPALYDALRLYLSEATGDALLPPRDKDGVL